MTIIPSAGSHRSRSSAPNPIVIVVVVVALVAAGVGAYAFTRPDRSSEAAFGTQPPSTRVAKPTPTLPSTPTPTGTSAAASPATMLARVKAAALAAGTVHANVTVPNGGRPITSTQVSGMHGGMQTITLGAARSNVLVVDDKTFIFANPAAMKLMYHANASDIRIWGGHWLQLVAADKAYASTTEGVSLPSMLDLMLPQGPLTLLPAGTVHGQRAFGIRGTLKTTGPNHSAVTLWVAADGPPLPVECDVSAPGGAMSTVVLSYWGLPAKFAIPDDVVHIRTTRVLV